MSNPVLVEVFRGSILESFHRGSVCAVNAQGEIIFSLGDPNQICYPRSAMKFVQALPLLVLGGIEKFGLTAEEIAITCGSHNGEPEHLRVVRGILSKIGLDESHLECGAQWPTNKNEADELVRTKHKQGAIHNNCSGKHAGMLALCVLTGNKTENYINPNHPIQLLILEYVSKFYEYPVQKMVCALDGCSAPIYSIPLYNQAIAFKNLSYPIQFEASFQQACKVLYSAIAKYPFLIAGSNRYCTELMDITAPQIIGKTGAEGVFCMSFTQQHIGVCIKIDDGKMLPQYLVAQALVEASGLFSTEQLLPLQKYVKDEIKNFNKLVTGEIAGVKSLFKPFSKHFQSK